MPIRKPKSVINKPKPLIKPGKKVKANRGGILINTFSSLLKNELSPVSAQVEKLTFRRPKGYASQATGAIPANFTPVWEYDVISSNLHHISYDPIHQMLKVEFRSSGIYVYWDVPLSEFAGLARAPSHGVYFWKHIRRGPYRYQRIK